MTKTPTVTAKNRKCNRFAIFYLDQLTADITFTVGPEECATPEKVPAHKILLASCSPVFNAMFFGSLPEQNDIRLIDASVDGFKEFLKYFYYDEMDKSKLECIVEVMYLAEKYEMTEYLAEILPYLMKTDPGICLELVAKCEFLDLQEICKQTLLIDNHEKFFELDSFVQYDRNILKMILGWEEAKCYTEELFIGCYRWAENTWKQQHKQELATVECEPTPADIRAQLGDLFDLIELSSLESHVLVTKLIKYADFFTKSDLVAMHKVMASKYPVAMDKLIDHACFLKADRKQQHIIKRIESVTFESSKDLYFIDYALGDDNFFPHLGNLHPYTMTLGEKALADDGKDIILIRKIVHKLFDEHPSGKDTIKIQANTKYQIRLIFSSLTIKKKMCVPTAYTSSVSELGLFDGEMAKITIEGQSIISKLKFKCCRTEK